VNGKGATSDINCEKTEESAGQLTNAEWMMSIPGTEEQKRGCSIASAATTLERVMRSTHDSTSGRT